MANSVNIGRGPGGKSRALRALLSVPTSTLLQWEYRLAEDAWQKVAQGSNTLGSADDLMQLMRMVNIPTAPAMNTLAGHFLASRLEGRFTFSDFIDFLQRTKTIHVKYRRKVEGCHFDDELLEAYVAVGGNGDTTGDVNVGAIRGVVEAFQLQLDLGNDESGGGTAFPSINNNNASVLSNSSNDGSPNASMAASPLSKHPHHADDNARLPFKAFMTLLKKEDADDLVPNAGSPPSANSSFSSAIYASNQTTTKPPAALLPNIDLDDLFRDDLTDFAVATANHNEDMFSGSMTDTPTHAAVMKAGRRRSTTAHEPGALERQNSSRGGIGGNHVTTGSQQHVSGSSSSGSGGGVSQQQNGGPSSRPTKLAPLEHSPMGGAPRVSGSKSPVKSSSIRRKQLPPIASVDKVKKHKFAT